jgi:TolR protein
MAGRVDIPGGDPGAEFADYKPLAEINVTPFVDVMLVLLVIFMVTAPLMMAGVPLDLPKTTAARRQPRDLVIVSVTKDGAVFLEDEEVPAAALVARLKELHRADPDATVYVRGDRALAYGRIMEVMGQIGQAGFARVSLISESAPPPAR